MKKIALFIALFVVTASFALTSAAAKPVDSPSHRPAPICWVNDRLMAVLPVHETFEVRERTASPLGTTADIGTKESGTFGAPHGLSAARALPGRPFNVFDNQFDNQASGSGRLSPTPVASLNGWCSGNCPTGTGLDFASDNATSPPADNRQTGSVASTDGAFSSQAHLDSSSSEQLFGRGEAKVGAMQTK